MASNTRSWLKNVQYSHFEFRCNNAFYCVAQGLVSTVDNFFHICVGLFCSVSRSGARWAWSQLYNSSSINFKWLRHFIQKQMTYSKHYWQRNKNLPPVFTFKKWRSEEEEQHWVLITDIKISTHQRADSRKKNFKILILGILNPRFSLQNSILLFSPRLINLLLHLNIYLSFIKWTCSTTCGQLCPKTPHINQYQQPWRFSSPCMSYPPYPPLCHNQCQPFLESKSANTFPFSWTFQISEKIFLNKKGI